MSLLKVPIFSSITDKGVAYFMSNWANDTVRMTSDTTFTRIPSKYACLNLPAWQNLMVRSLFLDGAEIDSVSPPTNPNLILPKAIQNYVENGISIALDNDVYSTGLTEAMFWKLMDRMNAVNFATVNGISYTDSYADQLVTYAGNITAMQHTDYKKQAFSEIIIYIPNEATKLDAVSWKTNSAILPSATQLPLLGVGDSKIFGWAASGDPNIDAVYDPALSVYDFGSNAARLGLDFESLSYSLNDSFDFNAVLIYYDTYENDVKTGTHLGGILFTDEFVQGTDTIYRMATKNKHKSQGVGNAIAFTLAASQSYSNTMADSAVVYNVYDAFSMSLYANVMQQTTNLATVYTELSDKINSKLQQLEQLVSSFATVTATQNMQSQLSNMQSQLNNMPTVNGLLSAYQTLTAQLAGATEVNPTFYNVFNMTQLGLLDADFFATSSLYNNTYAIDSLQTTLLKAFTSRFVDNTLVSLSLDSGLNQIAIGVQMQAGSQINVPGYIGTTLPGSLYNVGYIDCTAVLSTQFVYVIFDIITGAISTINVNQFYKLSADEVIVAMVKVSPAPVTAGLQYITQEQFLTKSTSLYTLMNTLNLSQNKVFTTQTLSITYDNINADYNLVIASRAAAMSAKINGTVSTITVPAIVNIPTSLQGKLILITADVATGIEFFDMSSLESSLLVDKAPVAIVMLHDVTSYIKNDVVYNAWFLPLSSISMKPTLVDNQTIQSVAYTKDTEIEYILTQLV